MQKFLPEESRATGAFTRLIDGFNPGVTMLVSIWVAAFALRRWLQDHELLSQIGYEALTSLIYVVPVMLVGWTALTISERWFGIRLSRGDDD
jgi:hypothetical protein